MRSYHVELPARRSAWPTDHAYQLRLTEQARTLAAAEGDVRPERLWLAAAGMPETLENVQLADRDEVRVYFTFGATKVAMEQGAQRRGLRRAASVTEFEQN